MSTSPPQAGRDPARPTLEAFFTERLMMQRQASPNTIASYRDTFRLLLGFAQRHAHKTPATLQLEDLDARMIAAFLDHLERDRHNSVRTRNNRLAAVHSLFRYAALRHPDNAALIQRVLAIPNKRMDRELISFLTADEIDAIVSAPDLSTWIGRRDHTLLLFGVQTGLRVSEITSLNCSDVTLGTGAHVRCRGKGRKDRVTPLSAQAVEALRTWLRERQGAPDEPPLPQPSRRPPQPRRRRTPRHQTRHHRGDELSVAAHQDRLTSHLAPQLRNAAP